MAASTTSALSLRGLRVASERTTRPILEINALELPEGQSLGIRGPSGAGKSTLLFAIAGLIEHATGDVWWRDTNLLAQTSERRAAFRAQNMGLIFQDFLLFEELTALANAALPALYHPKAKRRSIEENAAQLLARLGIPDTGRTVASFSGGERQRVAVARALSNDAKIILADEPTASLDRDAASSLSADLAQLSKDGRSLIAVSHDEALLEQMDRVMTIEDGRIKDMSQAAL